MKNLSELAGNIDEAERRYDELGQPNYISAYRVKELLQGWADKANRPELEEREHADASKIAYELFYRKAARLPKDSNVHLVTGPVAAGKSTAIGDRAGMTYEVNLSNKESWSTMGRRRTSLNNSSDTSTACAILEQSPQISISRSPEEHRKHADEWAKGALARLNKVGEQKAAEKAATR